MLHRQKHIDDGQLLEIKIRLDNIKEHMKLIITMIDELEKKINRPKITRSTPDLLNV
jgi:hypothetical protein